MKRKKIVAGNWKMNMTLDDSIELSNALININKSNVDVMIAPSFTNLYPLKKHFDTHQIDVIAQNVNQNSKGAFTGEVSVEMLKSIGVNCVIIGHSERRSLFGETDQILFEKVNYATSNDMNVIFCFGEELQQRQNGNYFDIIQQQLEIGVLSLPSELIKKVTLAYEPVWAIGTGVTANPDQIQEIHQFIRNLIHQRFDETISNSIRILYGGSVKSTNAVEIFNLADVDGGLIGGASLKFADFQSIVEAADV
ncbi:MAG: triose-phosphate isomerase [Bacteroidetes bacterium MED-G13]|nr:triose-phosphate isomerase [Flavobacteriaceae bacterium]PDH46509.1 MAG: triose-phosphate isomerase [Bacteroidetes bacterium MED-G13]|tara:strand:+ start:14207 stop:14962 length:756 start_codon:yes stop_codon:yes gene_type:complete